MAGIDQGGALAPHQEAVVGGAVAQAKLNIKAAAVPVERADRGGVWPDRLALEAEAAATQRSRRAAVDGGAGLVGAVASYSHGSPMGLVLQL